jgi:SSS family solute:Na+ symporter
LAFIDLGLVAAYFGVMLWVGWRARRSSPESYWVAERRYGATRVGASLVATIFGASSTLGIIGLGYSRGLTGAWWALIGGIVLIPFSLALAPRIRRMEIFTLPDILDRFYGKRVSIAGAAVIAVAWCGVVAAQIVAGGLLLGGLLPLSFQSGVAFVAVVFILYTLWGGQISVIRTDSWQIGLFLGGILFALVLVVGAGVREGVLLARVPQGHLSFPVSHGFGWYELLVYYPLIVGLPYLVGPDIYSRVLCSKDGSAARRAGILAAFSVLPLSFILAFLGIALHSGFPGLAPEEALPTAISTLAPPGLKGLIVVGLLGAVMSSADTTLISASTILSLNVVTPIKPLGRRSQLRLTRAAVVVVGLIGWLLAGSQEGIIASLLLAFTVFVGGIAIPTLAGFWKDQLRLTASGAFWAVVLGGGLAALGEARDGALLRAILGESGTGSLERALGPEYTSVLPLVVSAAALLLVSWGTRSSSDPGR